MLYILRHQHFVSGYQRGGDYHCVLNAWLVALGNIEPEVMGGFVKGENFAKGANGAK